MNGQITTTLLLLASQGYTDIVADIIEEGDEF